MWFSKIWKWLFGQRCCCCKCRGAERRRMNTNYINEESNYTFACEECFDGIQQHWADMWSDYYGSRL